MRTEDVAASVLDVAFAEEAPAVLNIVNPQRPAWATIMSSVRNAVLEQKSASLTSDDLPMVSFVDWVVRLEERADSATPEDLVRIVSVSHMQFLFSELCIDAGPFSSLGSNCWNFS